MYVTDCGIRQGSDGEVWVSTHREGYIIKIGGSSLGKALRAEVVTEVGLSDGKSIETVLENLRYFDCEQQLELRDVPLMVSQEGMV